MGYKRSSQLGGCSTVSQNDATKCTTASLCMSVYDIKHCVQVSCQLQAPTTLTPGSMGALKSRSGRIGEEKYSCFCRQSNPDYPIHNLVMNKLFPCVCVCACVCRGVAGRGGGSGAAARQQTILT
jgi:hypothetical protein